MIDRVTRGYFAGLSRTTFLFTFASLFSDVSTEMLYPAPRRRRRRAVVADPEIGECG
jgi:hypothetical protein